MSKKRKKYTKEDLKESINLIVQKGRCISELSRKIDVSANLLRNLVRQSTTDKIEPFPVKVVDPRGGDLRRSKRENTRLRMEHDISKKAAAIVSEEPY